jgi:hypothetical protein
MVANFSRRRVLALAASIGGTIGCVAAPPARASGGSSDSQLRKQDVQYQAGPKGNQRCDLCSNFLVPSGCRVVSGGISPNGWCLLFKPKQ